MKYIEIYDKKLYNRIKRSKEKKHVKYIDNIFKFA